MIGRPRLSLVATAVAAFAAVHVGLAVSFDHRVVHPMPYYTGLVLVLLACAGVLRWPPQPLRRPYAVVIVAATVTAALCVLAVLPTGKPSYAMWYPSIVPVPLGGVALNGYPVLALVGAGAVAAGTTAWTAVNAEGVAEGLYRTVTPTAAVVVCVGVWALARAAGRDVALAHAQELAAREERAVLQARDAERADRLADVARLAGPVLSRLADGRPVDRRTARECALLETAVRDSIRGRRIADATVASAAWAARARGVQVALLDDGGGTSQTDAAGTAVLRRAAATALELLSSGRLTARAVPRESVVGTVVVESEDAAAVARALRAIPGVIVEVDGDEVVATIVSTASRG
jgi:hypothetical protein